MLAEWLTTVRDETAAARIAKRLTRVQIGLLDDVKPVGDGVSELRIDYGPSYRVYFVAHGALGISARARGMGKVAREAGVTHGGLYKAISQDVDPRLTTLLRVVKALGIKLIAEPAG